MNTPLMPFLLILLLLAGCRPTPEENHQATPYELPTPMFFPSMTNIPADNPMTEEGVALGKKLFHDPNYSALTSLRASPFRIPHSAFRIPHSAFRTCCASCHRPEHSFELGPEGTLDHLGTPHAMLPLVNLAWNTEGLGWNGSVATIEDMVLAATTHPLEIAADTALVVQRLQQSEAYPTLFYQAFGTHHIHFDLVQKAIAQYVRSLVFTNSKFDRYLRGEEQLTQDELNGYLLFITEDGADCFHCHGGGANALFTTHLFYNNGLDNTFDDPHDRFSVTNDPRDRGAYKAPTLRNIALTAPYMHDGRFQTLEEVIDFYSDSVQYSENISPLMHHVMQGGVRLTAEEKTQLKAFLLTLTSD